MKKSRLIGIGVATIGVALSVGVSLALYVHADAAKQIGIGVFTPHTSEDGDVNYVIDSVTPGVGNAAYSPSHLTNSYSFRLGATKGEDSHLPLQKYTVGDLTIVISSTNETLINNLTATAEIAVPTGKWQDNDYGNITGDKASDGKVELAAAVKDVSGTAKTLTLSLANFTAQTTKDVLDGTNSIVSLNLALANNLAESTVLNIAEATYTITASWLPAANFNYAYVTGTQYGWSTTASEARMVPNADSYDGTFEWMYQGYTDTTPGDARGAKCIKTEGDTTAWSGGNDASIAIDKQYDFYWSGTNGEAASVSNPY